MAGSLDANLWAILEKLSPARRVLLLLALLLLFITPELSWTTEGGTHRVGFDLQLWGGLLMFVLLMLEVADRVVMKRDLEESHVRSKRAVAVPPSTRARRRYRLLHQACEHCGR